MLNLNEALFKKVGDKMLGTAYENLFKQNRSLPVRLNPSIEGVLLTGGFLSKSLKQQDGKYPWEAVKKALGEANGDNSESEQSALAGPGKKLGRRVDENQGDGQTASSREHQSN